jgi:lysophospholipase L1-like esterase
MDRIALFFASGDSIYPGAGSLIVAVSATPFLRRRSLTVLRNLALWLGAALIVMASPPFDWWIDGMLATVFLFWIFSWSRFRSGSSAIERAGATAILVAMLLVISLSELLHRRMPVVRGASSNHVVIIGDSISAGIGRSIAWPILLERQTGIRVENLSVPGAGVTDAVAMAARVVPEDSMVVIEIGGNDFLFGVPSAEFSRKLDLLLSRRAAPGRLLVMFELPLLPNKVGYGIAQRRLAARYGVFLIPKHCFTDVLGSADATMDGLHLSDVGAQRMADLVQHVLAPVLKPTS